MGHLSSIAQLTHQALECPNLYKKSHGDLFPRSGVRLFANITCRAPSPRSIVAERLSSTKTGRGQNTWPRSEPNVFTDVGHTPRPPTAPFAWRKTGLAQSRSRSGLFFLTITRRTPPFALPEGTRMKSPLAKTSLLSAPPCLR